MMGFFNLCRNGEVTLEVKSKRTSVDSSFVFDKRSKAP
jgi:hypothetical protein